jgi:hypothetical protein
MKKNKEEIKFELEQLRKDKMVYALESIALSMLALLIFIGAPSVFPKIINPYLESSLKILQAVIIVPVVYFLYMLVGNLVRLVKIQKLTKGLQGKKK